MDNKSCVSHSTPPPSGKICNITGSLISHQELFCQGIFTYIFTYVFTYVFAMLFMRLYKDVNSSIEDDIIIFYSYLFCINTFYAIFLKLKGCIEMVNSERIYNHLLAEIGAGKKAVVTTVIENILQNDCQPTKSVFTEQELDSLLSPISIKHEISMLALKKAYYKL